MPHMEVLNWKVTMVSICESRKYMYMMSGLQEFEVLDMKLYPLYK